MKEEFSDKIKLFFDLINKYELLIDNINIQTWYLSSPDTYSIVNQAHADFLGKKKEELYYNSIKGILNDSCVEKNKYVFESKQPLSTREDYRNHSGERRVLKINRIPQLDESGEVAFVMCTGEDITDLLYTKQSRDFLGKIVERSYDAVIVTNLDFKIVYINQAAENLFGYSFKELRGKYPDMMVHEDNKEEIRENIKRVLKNEDEFFGNYVNMRKNGTTFICSYRITPMYEDGNVVNYISYHRDITRKVQLDRELESICNQFETIFKESPLSIIVHDKDTGEIINANKKALEYHGFSSLKEMKETDFWCSYPYSFEDALWWIKKTVEEGHQEIEWKIKDKNGNVFWEIVNLKVINVNGIDRVLAISKRI